MERNLIQYLKAKEPATPLRDLTLNTPHNGVQLT